MQFMRVLICRKRVIVPCESFSPNDSPIPAKKGSTSTLQALYRTLAYSHQNSTSTWILPAPLVPHFSSRFFPCLPCESLHQHPRPLTERALRKRPVGEADRAGHGASWSREVPRGRGRRSAEFFPENVSQTKRSEAKDTQAEHGGH